MFDGNSVGPTRFYFCFVCFATVFELITSSFNVRVCCIFVSTQIVFHLHGMVWSRLRQCGKKKFVSHTKNKIKKWTNVWQENFQYEYQRCVSILFSRVCGTFEIYDIESSSTVERKKKREAAGIDVPIDVMCESRTVSTIGKTGKQLQREPKAADCESVKFWRRKVLSKRNW